jgi:hypothetical protein
MTDLRSTIDQQNPGGSRRGHQRLYSDVGEVEEDILRRVIGQCAAEFVLGSKPLVGIEAICPT